MPINMYGFAKKVAYSIPPLLYYYRKAAAIFLLTWLKIVTCFHRTQRFSRRIWIFLNKDVVECFHIVIILISFKLAGFKVIRSSRSMRYQIISSLYKNGIIRLVPSHQSMCLLAKMFKLIVDEKLKHELLELHKKHIKSYLNPRKKTIAFFHTTRAYRGNLGNITQKMRQKRLYNVITLIGEITGDNYEHQSNVFYWPNDNPASWTDLNFIDVCITVRPFYPTKIPSKTVYFLHDIHDSAIGRIEDNLRLLLDINYIFLGSTYIVKRVTSQIVEAKEKYLTGQKPDKPFCVIGGGYPRLDRNLDYFQHHHRETKTLIFVGTAPEEPDTAGLLVSPSDTDRVLGAILDSFPDYRLIYRPHPLTTNYKEIQDIANKYQSHPMFIYDNNAATYIENYCRSTLMIADASGTAYTYAFSTLRPVVFFSPNEPGVARTFGSYQYFIDRNKVGYIAETVEEVIEKIRLLLKTRDEFSEKIRQYRDSIIFNIGKSEDYFVDNFDYIIKDKKHPDWEYI